MGIIAVLFAAADHGHARITGHSAASGCLWRRVWRAFLAGRGVGNHDDRRDLFLIRSLGGFSFGELALRGSALWGYAVLWGLVFISLVSSRSFFFAAIAIHPRYRHWILARGHGLSARFGAIHLGNGGEDKIGALSVFVIAMFFCLTLRRTGNLWFAVGLHAAFDWGETFLFSVPDSGLLAPGHLLNSSFHGPVWLTGGTVGPEGSVMSFAVVRWLPPRSR